MKKILLTVLTLTLFFLFSGRVRAQDFVTFGLTAQATACPTNPGNSSSSTSAVTLSTLNAGGATFTIGSSAFSGTVAFFASGDGGTTWVGLNVFPSSSTTPVTGASAAGLWQANVSAYTHVCMAATTFSSGTITVTIRKSTVSASAGRGGGGAAPAGATNSIQTNGGGGALSSITNPTTPNSRAQVLTSTPSGGVGGTPAFALPGDSPTDRPSGEASYTIGVTDIGNSIRETNASGEAFTIPDGNTGGFVLPVNIGFIIEGGTSTIARTTSSQVRCMPNGALANTCNLTVGGQYILKETSDFNYTLSVSGDVALPIPTGCTSGCNYVLGFGDDPAQGITTGQPIVTINQGVYMKFFNALQRKVSNACIFVTTSSAGGHGDVGIFSISGTTGTLQWHTGSFSTASTGIQCFTPAAYSAPGNANFYMAFCADNVTANVDVIASSPAGINGGVGAPANTWGIDATDTCTAGVLPATITTTNIANQASRTTFPYVYVNN